MADCSDNPNLAAANVNEEAVILIHGLWMNGGVLWFQQRWLRQQGFAVRRFSYPSWHGGLADNVRLLSRFIAETPAPVIHLVAHSLGGLVSLRLLAEQPDPRIRRVVLMATPCAGSHCGDVLQANPALATLIGQTYKDWSRLPLPDIQATVEIGVIAGTQSFGTGRLIPGLATPNDGLLTVAETDLPQAKDRIRLPVSHSGMLVSAECALQVASFLRSGAFVHA